MKNSINFPIALLILITLACACPDPKEQSTTPITTDTNQNNQNPTPEEKAIIITAKDLSKAYDENELAADEKYKGKKLEVTGSIEDIAETMGNITVSLKGHDILKNVMCSFPEEEKGKVAKLKKGEKTTLVGIGDGKTLSLYAGLTECKIK